MLDSDAFVVYGGTGNHALDARVLTLAGKIAGLTLTFGHIWYETWPDGEPGFTLEAHGRIEGRHAIVFSCPFTYELESELRDLVTACKRQYAAQSVTVVLSYLRYRRQDHAEKTGEITRLRWFLHDLKFWGADRLIVCDPHAVGNTEAFCRECDLVFHPCDPTARYADEIRPLVQDLGAENVCIYTPDFGSAGRAVALARATGTSVVATPKQRLGGDAVEIRRDFDRDGFLRRIRDACGSDVPISCDLSELDGRHVFMREDELSTGGTAVLTAAALRGAGARSVRLLATHPVCTRGWKTKLFPSPNCAPFDGVYLGNTRPRGEHHSTYQGSTGGRVKTVDMAPAIARTLVEVLGGIR